MKINHNLSAMIANDQLLRNENSLTTSIERLSSGLKINRAADDAAGMAIATKMRAQIKGLDQASRNASDGVSVVETADGALQEVTNMLQRMRELSVQAANEIYVDEDKEAIQAEILSLTDEINRISTDTEFNKKKILDGSLDQRVYTNSRGIKRIDITDSVAADKYKIWVEQDARQAVLIGSTVQQGDIPAGVVSLNGVDVEITEGQDLETVYENLRTAAEKGEINLVAVDNLVPDQHGEYLESAGYKPAEFTPGMSTLVFVSERYGTSTEMKIVCDNPALANFLGITEEATANGTDAKITLEEGFTKQASYTSDGNDVTITDRNGFKITFRADPGVAGTVYGDPTMADAGDDVVSATVIQEARTEIEFDVTDIGTMTLQIGANEDQVMDIRIPAVSAESLYIDDIDVCTIYGASRAITAYDKAIAKVSESRARLGAYQNRLEQATSSLDSTEINMTSALSRIEDVDMAQEMSAYTQYNVLTQAATSVLAQANDIPQQALQLLQ